MINVKRISQDIYFYSRRKDIETLKRIKCECEEAILDILQTEQRKAEEALAAKEAAKKQKRRLK